jgi:predicted DNA-binding transcriptional regulator AlpA
MKFTPKLFLKSAEVEEIYGISASTLANWRSKRRGPKYHKVGGSVRYKVEDLDKFMESKKIRTD